MKKDKMTKEQKIKHIMTIEGVKDDEIAMEYLQNELTLLENRKNAESKKDKEKKTLNESLTARILEILEGSEEGISSASIAAALGDGTTPQKVVSLLGNLLNTGDVERITYKRKQYYIKKERAEKWVEELTMK